MWLGQTATVSTGSYSCRRAFGAPGDAGSDVEHLASIIPATEGSHRILRPSLPQSPLGKAVTYALGEWNALNSYLQDGRVEIDNNLTENGSFPHNCVKFLVDERPPGLVRFCTAGRWSIYWLITLPIIVSTHGSHPHSRTIRIELPAALARITPSFDSLVHVCYKIGIPGGMF
jgi:hypothetical protein